VAVPMIRSLRMEELRRPLSLFLGILGTVPRSRASRATALHLQTRAHARARRPGPEVFTFLGRGSILLGPANVHFPHLNPSSGLS
jgi:hypothetical protein